MHFLSMFYDKNSDGEHFSMTRLIAFMFGVVYLYALIVYAQGKTTVNWPFAALGVVTLLAVPIQAIFAYLQKWIASQPGQELLTTAIHKVEESLLPGAPTRAPDPPPPTVQTVTTVTPGENKG